MPTELVDLVIEEVSGVDAAANKRTFLIIKRAEPDEQLLQKDMLGGDDDEESPPMTLEERQQSRQLWQQWYPLWWDFQETVAEVMDGDEDDLGYAGILMQSIDQFRTQAHTLLTRLGLIAKATAFFAVLNDVQKVGAVLSANRKKRLQDAIAALQAILDEASPTASPEAPSTQKGVAMAETLEMLTKRAEAAEATLAALEKRATIAEARVQELEPQLATLKAELETAQTTLVKAQQTPEEQEAEYEASLPEHVRKQRQAEKLELVELKKRLQESDDRAERTEYIQKTAAYRALGLTPDDWNVLKAIDTLPEDLRTRLTTLMKALTEQLKTSTLFKSMGIDGGQGGGEGEGAGGSVEAHLLSLTAAYQEKHNCDMPTAQNAVMKMHPDVYERYVVEKRRNTRVSSE